MRYATLLLAALAPLAQAQDLSAPAPISPPTLAYDAPFFPGAHYDANVPTPDSVLGFRLGDKAASPEQIETVVRAIAAKSPRVKLVEYARTHEGRPLHYLIVTKPERLGKLDDLKADLAKLADPRTVSAAEGDRLAGVLPAVAWMAYVIHGDEMSGSDASLALLYHLAACTDDDVKGMLEELVVLIDPLMNPDGRERAIVTINQTRSRAASVDDQALPHSNPWPTGRMNHYLFDMNRDWIFGTQPETRGRIVAARDWNPHYFMESHEMGSQDTFLMMPAREPFNPNYPASLRRWTERFAQEQGAAFDAMGWRYYTGEWNENWYPGYSSSWGALRGAVENLYEMANIMSDAVRRPEGTLQAYREAVHHQLVSSWANLSTLRAHRGEVLKDFLAEKRRNVAGEGSQRVFAVRPGANVARLERFLDLMRLQGFEVLSAAGEFKASGRDRLGRELKDAAFPAGTLLIPTRQPLAPLVRAMLDLDPRFTGDFLTDERRELLRFGRSRLYDVTAWNVGLFFDLDVCELDVPMPEGAAPAKPAPPPRPMARPDRPPVAYLVGGSDDRSVALAGRLMERGVWVRVADKTSRFDGRDFPRGSVVVLRKDNPARTDDLARLVGDAAGELSLDVRAVESGMGPGDLPDLGGEHFVLLQPARIAVVGREPFGPYSYGEAWHLLDHTLGLRASYLDFAAISGADLRRYNVIVLPDGPDDDALKGKLEALRAWVQGGGTLIAIGSSAAALAKEGGIGSTRVVSDVLGKLDEYRMGVIREWEGLRGAPKADDVWGRGVPAKLEYPWTIDDADKPTDDELKRRDAWRKIFSPQGALLAARVDDRSWLTAGCADDLPVLYGGATVLMAPTGVAAPLRFGVFVDAPKPGPKAGEALSDPGPREKSDNAKEGEKGDKKDAKPPPPGWRVAPPGHEMVLRLSGLLWPEYADRVANSAYVTREGVGNGQVILFASSPTTRAATLGTQRVLSNAMVYGPGMGARPTIRP